jgi:hypothetical protein
MLIKSFIGYSGYSLFVHVVLVYLQHVITGYISGLLKN